MAKKKGKSNNVIKIAIAVVVLAGLVLAVILLVRKFALTTYNDNPTVNGNTAGNLYNKGLYTEADGVVYFSNPLDHGYLYAMNADETKASRLSVETVYSLNACGEYLYYAKDNTANTDSTSIFRGFLLGAARCNLKGKRVVDLNDRYTGTMVLIGNTIYFQDYENNRKKGTTTFDIKAIGIDGKKSKTFASQAIEIAGTTGSIIYHVGIDDHNIYALNTRTGGTTTVVEGNCWMPIVDRQDLYYLDLSNRYSLVKTKINNPEHKEVLVNERISTYNVSDTYIYFQIDDQENSKLCRIRRDGMEEGYEVVAEGNYENINITSRYVYFNVFGSEDTTLRTPVNGPVDVRTLSESVAFDQDK